MRRYWIDKSNLTGDEVSLEGELLHHIVDVCRVSEGQKFEVLVDGVAYLVQLQAVGKKQTIAKVVERREIAALPTPHIHLCLSMPKFPKVDLIVEKSVELGVKSLIPFVSENSFVRKLSKIPDKKMQRWDKIVVSATQQSGRGELMDVHSPMPLKELLKSLKFDERTVGILPFEGACEKNLKQIAQAIQSVNLKDVYVFVGSEGGFSQAEVALFKSFGVLPVTVGEQVLRVETACISIVSMLNYELHL